LHAQIQTKASTSQEKHTSTIDVSKKIEDLKKKEKKINTQIDEHKKILRPISNELGVKLKKLADLSAKAHIEVKKTRERQEKKLKKKLFDRQVEVQEKIKRGEKLTTEDLLIIQTIEEKEE